MVFVTSGNDDIRGREETLPNENTVVFTDGDNNSMAEGVIKHGLYGT